MIFPSRRPFGVFFLAILLAVATRGYAQTAPQPVSPENLALPGQVQQQNQRPESLHVTPPEPSLEAPPEPQVEQAPAKHEAPDASLTQRFKVSKIEVQGEKH